MYPALQQTTGEKCGLGYGLDESALEALEQWRFEPGKKDGEAVNVQLPIEVNFPGP